MEYTVDTVFYAIEIENMFRGMVKDSKYEGDNDAKRIKMTPVDLTYLYHIVSKHTVKGLGEKTRLFANVISIIGYSSKVFNYYSELFKNVSEFIQRWILALDGEGLTDDDKIFIGIEIGENKIVESSIPIIDVGDKPKKDAVKTEPKKKVVKTESKKKVVKAVLKKDNE